MDDILYRKNEEFWVQSWPERTDRGGQYVGSGPVGVKVTHTPTGTHAACDLHRSQHKNRQAAMEAVTWMLNT